MIDLHTHTTFSDGTFSPEELMKYAKEKRLEAIAITDHDTVDALPRAAVQASKLNIEFVNGVEISADYKGLEIHILGYFIDTKNMRLKEFLKTARQKREERNIKMITAFQREGYDIFLDELLKLSGGGMISRIHFARLLIEKNYSSDISHAFKNFLRPGTKTHLRRELPSFKEAADIIRGAGGIVSIAHPVNYHMTPGEMEEMIAEVKPDAIEAVYTKNTPADNEFFLILAGKYGLKISGGSDFHGQNKPSVDLAVGFGNLNIDYSVLKSLKELKKQRD